MPTPEILIDKSKMNIFFIPPFFFLLKSFGERGDEDFHLQVKGTAKRRAASVMVIQVRSPATFARGWEEWTRLK